MPAIVKAQTTKQAKAAYKARGRPTLSDKEQRQLQRAIELEERAEKAREAERRRTEAAKKRAEKEKSDRFASESARLGSQRRTDKFGFVASQFHLGKFFGKPMVQSEAAKARHAGTVGKQAEAESEDEFGDDEDLEDEYGSDDLDDDTLLEALKSPDAAKKSAPSPGVVRTPNAWSMPPPPRPSMMGPPQTRTPVAVLRPPAVSMAPPPRPAVPSHAQTAKSRPTKSVVASRPQSKLMPPPPRPHLGIHKSPSVPQPLVQEDIDSFWDALDSSTQIARDLDDAGPSGAVADLGFTFTELEDFIDDDIQLSQAVRVQ